MFKKNQIRVVARIILMAVIIAGAIGAMPVQAGAKTIGGTTTGKDDWFNPSNGIPTVNITTPSYPVGIRNGEMKFVPYQLEETNNASGEITNRTYQFYTQYDVPLSEAIGPFSTLISVDSLRTNGWNEAAYLPRDVVNKARGMDEYALVLKTSYEGISHSGVKFSAQASLLILLPPAEFGKSAPPNEASVSPSNQSLRWNSSVGAIDYEYCFDTIDNNSCDTNWTGTYNTNTALQDLPPDTTFYWQVRANNMAGTTYADNGNWWSFTTCTSSLITVTNTNDSGAGSLRQAIADICSGGTITFAPALSGQTITLNSVLVVDKDLIINGSSLTTKISISGNNSVRVLEISPDATVSLNGLVVKNGYSSTHGGGIYNSGSLTVTNCVFFNNSSDINGGAIFNTDFLTTMHTGTLTVMNSTFLGNSAHHTGGGISNGDGQLDIMDSTFSGNSAKFGGGLITGFGTEVNVTNSTFSENSAEWGGGMFNDLTLLTLANNTFFHNLADYGGGLYNASVTTITNSTFSGNSAASSGGGIYNDWGLLNYTNTILANSISGDDCYNNIAHEARIGINNNNLVLNNAAAPNDCGIPLLTSDPLLGPLQNNGGLTQTMALLPGSPAIDAGDDANCPATDQRGVTRPQGSHCDIGAYEFVPTPTVKPGIPALLSPANGALVNTLQPTLDWEDSSPVALYYQLQVSADNAFTALVVDKTNLPTSQFTFLSDLDPSVRYYWRVRGLNAIDEAGDWSEIWGFTTGNPPSVPVLVSPAEDELVTSYRPLFDWQNSTNPSRTAFKRYEIQVDEDENFGSPIFTATTAEGKRTDSKFTPATDLPSNIRLYWRVRAVNEVGGVENFSAWSVVRSFRSAIQPPILLSPAPGIIVETRTPTFDWADVPEASGYTIQVSTHSNFRTLLVNSNTIDSAYAILTDLPANKVIYWRVQTQGLFGPSAWSTTFQFKTPR
jgi:hypothetical protein